MAANDKKEITVTVTAVKSRSSIDSVAPSLKTPRVARFAEATAVHSPIEPKKSPFADLPTNHYTPQPQPADVGFGYLSANAASRHASYQSHGVEMEETDRRYLPPPTPMSPLKSAMKSPGTPGRKFDALRSPTFREEQILEKHEESTEKEQAQDLKIKFRVRIAKVFLRGINFACSLIILSMLATVFAIFNATRHLAPRNNSLPWASNTPTWPQITLLTIACISLFMSIVVLAAYWRGGHGRAEKVAVYYTVFAVAFFVFSIVMWGVGAAILNQSKANGNGQDLWGWSCKDNRRRQLFKDDVSYDLVCRLQDWALVCCIIEIVVETITILIYGIVFYRYYSKRRLRKSMAVRDRARSDLYLAQLRSQSAPNTPGFGPLSPRDGGWRPPPGHKDPIIAAEEGDSTENVQYPRGFAQPKPFNLMPPPIKIQGATPKVTQGGFGDAVAPASPTVPTSPRFEIVQDHVPAAPGEQTYAAVPIPGAYASPLNSPGLPPANMAMSGFDFGPSVNAEQRPSQQ
ncbi:hypothetical protein W97_08556 [Coniosporium apollinis CBS 100218]|uniref:MARVEL domain-containing protein n=1 Tax=Coniosporium apollinis (strain CBS 100218) TaxID=1168221 RepID=R7Z4V3_CONA1|nr:uncharacterized protein W97_08556 [Coniosporium apollinis CBS 100218]EON69197.1 hypothetical protein W97_08556 [Coniosporium apollinis CBS 100218]